MVSIEKFRWEITLGISVRNKSDQEIRQETMKYDYGLIELSATSINHF